MILAASILPAGFIEPAPSQRHPELDQQITASLALIRTRANLPALAGGIVTTDGLQAAGVVGVRKIGIDQPATLHDDWHLGSDTKAMTATLVGLLVDEGKLHFESTLADIFPDLAPEMPDLVRHITIEQLLAHRSGLPHDPAKGWRWLSEFGSLQQQRRAAVREAGREKLLAAPGTAFNYSNWGYVILGAIVEETAGRPWENLMRRRIFEPLQMNHAGFGGTGTEGQVDQPWPHRLGRPMVGNGPGMDNPPVMAPAGEVHCPIDDWAKFVANELRGLRGEPNLLSAATFKRLRTPALGANYAGGWICVPRSWARGLAYTHSGSNNMNYCTAWLAPTRNVAFLVCTNEGDAAKPCDDAVGALLKACGNAY